MITVHNDGDPCPECDGQLYYDSDDFPGLSAYVRCNKCGYSEDASNDS